MPSDVERLAHAVAGCVMRGSSAALGSWKMIWKSRRWRRKLAARERIRVARRRAAALPAGRLQQADDGAPERRLARARFADDAECLAARHGEAHAVDGLHRLGPAGASRNATRRSLASTMHRSCDRSRQGRARPAGRSAHGGRPARRAGPASLRRRRGRARSAAGSGSRPACRRATARGPGIEGSIDLRGLSRGIERSRPDV